MFGLLQNALVDARHRLAIGIDFLLQRLDMCAAKIIKRYKNRKLYDTEQSCYVHLEAVKAMVQAGEEIQVVDNKTSEDITSVIYAQIICQQEKRKELMATALLRDIIRLGGQREENKPDGGGR